MTRKNPYENQEDTLDIPDFLEDKNGSTDSSVDMSIFKMSDDELYDDVQETEEDDGEPLEVRKSSGGRKRSNTPLILSIVTICILLATCIGAAIFALNQHKAYVKVNTDYQQLLAAQDSYKTQIAQKDSEIAELKKQLEEKKETVTPEGGTVYVVTDGPIAYRDAPVHSEPGWISYKGVDQLENGERFTAIKVVKGTDDDEYTYAMVAEGVYLCLGTPDDVWAEKAD